VQRVGVTPLTGARTGAQEIGVEFKTLAAYRKVAAAWPAGTRVPAASWAVHRALRSEPAASSARSPAQHRVGELVRVVEDDASLGERSGPSQTRGSARFSLLTTARELPVFPLPVSHEADRNCYCPLPRRQMPTTHALLLELG